MATGRSGDVVGGWRRWRRDSRRGRLARLLLAVAALAASAGAASAQPPRLPALGAAREGTTVSGISSGAFMAVQFQVAFSGEIAGVGAVAGGPYLCAEGSVTIAQLRCLDAQPFPPDAAYLWRRTVALSAFGHIEPVANLARARVYVFHGGNDLRVRRPVAESLVDYYRQAGVPPANLAVRFDLPAGHGFVVTDGGIACEASAPPFINDCDHDQAGAILAHLLALPAAPQPAPGRPPAGRLLPFAQADAALPDPRRHGMDEEGFVYVPPGCEAGGGGGGGCRVHVVFHGCRQGRSMLMPPDGFARATGFLGHADALRLVLLFPQAAPLAFSNPLGCWDFFAYDDPAYHTRRGRQMAAVKRMLDRLREPPGAP
jgi:hypothetical protein